MDTNTKSVRRTATPTDLNAQPSNDKLREFSKRFSQISSSEPQNITSNADELRKRFLAVRLKNYKPQKVNLNFYLSLLIGFTVITSLVAYSAVNNIGSTPKKNYCSSYVLENQSDCVPCPEDAICNDGVIERCIGEKILHGDACIPNDKMLLLKNQIATALDKIIAKRNGDLSCHNGIEKKAELKFSDIEKVLGSSLRKKQHFKEALDRFESELKTSIYGVGNLSYREELDHDYNFIGVLSSSSVEYDLVCKAQIFFNMYQYYIYLGIAFFVALLGFIVKRSFDKKYIIIAETLYKNALSIIKSEGKINVRNLLGTYEGTHLSKSERDTVLRKMEHIRKVDEQASTIIEQGEKYWVLI